MTNFHLTPAGSLRARKERRDESCVGPSIVLRGEVALWDFSGDRYRRVSSMKKDAGPWVNW